MGLRKDGPRPAVVGTCTLRQSVAVDADDQLRLMKQLIEAENIDEKRWPARPLASMIDGWKNRGLTPDKVPRGEAFAAEGVALDPLFTASGLGIKV